MQPQPLHFYFDFISPYGYFASLRIEELAAHHGRTVEWHSMLLGVSVLKVMGLKPLLDTPLKGDYVRRDVMRYARRHAVPLARSFDRVPDPLPAARAFHWVKRHNPEKAVPLAHALYEAIWALGQDVDTAAQVAAIAKTAGIEDTGLEAAIDSDEARSLLRVAVHDSLAAGIFGSPTVVVDGEPFWGVERLPEVEVWLARGGW